VCGTSREPSTLSNQITTQHPIPSSSERGIVAYNALVTPQWALCKSKREKKRHSRGEPSESLRGTRHCYPVWDDRVMTESWTPVSMLEDSLRTGETEGDFLRHSSAQPIGHSGAFVAKTLESSSVTRWHTKSWTPVSLFEDSRRTAETDVESSPFPSFQCGAF
jgi:hypothetical protein